ncbi:MAG: S8 family serine peptidase [Polyangiaceae bacterium]|jgi:serine protease AprX|nr:S8 family serine peptidase [Polyangiaceae bacterium]
MLRPQILSLVERLDAALDVTGKGVTVAFVDLGFYPHPDLVQPTHRIKAYADVARPKPSPEEFFQPHPASWHGTMTACVAAGNGYVSGGRFRGLASESEVVLLRAASPEGTLQGRHVASALRFPLRYPDLQIRVLSISLGISPDDPDVTDVERAIAELHDAGISVVAAAGNDPSAEPEVPGSCAEVISVGGSNDRNTRDGSDDLPWPSSYRRAGRQKPDLVAPAILVPAPMLPGTTTSREAQPLFELISALEEAETERRLAEQLRGKKIPMPESQKALHKAIAARLAAQKYISPHYQHVDGTSFAAPITASVVVQMLAVNPALTPREIKRGLVMTARPLPGVPERQQGAGVLQPREAVEWARKRRK